MEIVLTHNNMDFDSLAAQYAVSLLFPGVRILPGYPLVGNVREFLSLYRNKLPISQSKYVDWPHVNHVYIVDCQHADRLDENVRKMLLEKRFTYTIFDHHEMETTGLGPGARQDSIVREVGSSTTLLVELIRQKGIQLTAFDATLLLIGIYEDTGCLTYGGTSPTDAECVAYLLKCGADLQRVNDFMHPKMSEAQTKLLEELIHNSRAVNISGLKVLIATASLPRYLDGLATLTRKLVEIESTDAVITVARMRDRIHLVGRSDNPAVDVRLLLRKFGGDGHPGASSAVVKETDVQDMALRVEEALRMQIKPELTAAEIMTCPVRTIRTRTTMEEAGRIMLRYDLDGLVVAEDHDLVGIISRRDIDQATHHKLGHAPVQGFMSKPVITIKPDTPLSEIQRVMVHEDIGRLPVLSEEGLLLGIVSRKEVLSTLYGEGSMHNGRSFEFKNRQEVELKDKLESLSAPSYWLLQQIGLVAAQLNMVAYLVGGCVRDLILDLPNFDLDFVVEGSAIKLAEALENAYPARLQVVARHERFQTATVAFNADKGLEVDLSTARTEFYEFPAALPTVEASGLQQDLFRRDFTINALAICLNPDRYGQLVDYFDGLHDLESKTIRILHPFSFIEDPTRIIRAARFASRFDFSLDPHTRQQAQRAIGMGIFDDLGGVRMRTELKLILTSGYRLKALDLLGQLGGRLCYLDADLEYTPKLRRRIRLAERLLSRYRIEEDWVVYLGLLVSQLSSQRRVAVLDRLHLHNEAKEQINKGLDLMGQLPDMDKDLKPSSVYSIFHGLSDQSLAIAACTVGPGSPVRRLVKLYLEKLKHVDVVVTGADLLKMGLEQGPQIGLVLNSLTEAKLDGLVRSAADEVAYIKEHFLPGGKG